MGPWPDKPKSIVDLPVQPDRLEMDRNEEWIKRKALPSDACQGR